MKIHLIKYITYCDDLPDGGRTYCGITEESENLEGCLTQNINEVTCKKCLKSFKKGDEMKTEVRDKIKASLLREFKKNLQRKEKEAKQKAKERACQKEEK